jgi:sec-independent protein translocase protein TatB
MFDIGWPEMLVIAVVMIVVVGPKDLPKMLRTFGRTTTKLRSMAGDFRKQFDEALKEAELDDLKTLASDARKLNPANEIKKALSPMEKAAQDVRAGLDAAMKPQVSSQVASTPQPLEPAKAGPAAIPGETPKPVAASKPASAKPAAGANGKAAAASPTTAKPATAKPAAAKAKPAAPAKPKAPARPRAARAKAGGTAT